MKRKNFLIRFFSFQGSVCIGFLPIILVDAMLSHFFFAWKNLDARTIKELVNLQKNNKLTPQRFIN
jgi:hypothetical protein